MVKTIIFDFDGTIADTFDFTIKQIVESLKKTKLSSITEKEVREKIRIKSYRELKEEFKISWLQLPFILMSYRKRQEELFPVIEKIKTFPSIREIIFELKKKGFLLGILSSNLKKNIDKFLLVNNLQVFDFVHCDSNLFGKDKALKKLIKKYRLEKEEVIYIGDEVRDIEACKKAGVKIISVSWGFNSKELLSKNKLDYLIDRPEEILSIVNC